MRFMTSYLVQIIRNHLHNNHSPISVNHPCNQDQQNHPPHPYALHAIHPHIFILSSLKIILFSILHFGTFLVFSLNIFYVGVCIAVVVFVRAVAVRYARNIFFVAATYYMQCCISCP